MKIDVSEIKSFRSCKRQWKLSSRNNYHLTPLDSPKALRMGSLFHEALAQMYLGANFDRVLALVKKEMSRDDVALIAMLKGYNDHVLPYDLEQYRVLEVECKFEFPANIEQLNPSPLDDITCCGAIDLIVEDKETHTIFGIEHKTCGQFRDPHLILMDQQPRLYYEALKLRYPLQPVGGIYINEVKKLLRDFQYKRTLCDYSDSDRQGFWAKWIRDLWECSQAVNKDQGPEPNYWTCQMCDYKEICTDIGYGPTPPLPYLIENYSTGYKVREQDHLEEKLDFGRRLDNNDTSGT